MTDLIESKLHLKKMQTMIKNRVDTLEYLNDEKSKLDELNNSAKQNLEKLRSKQNAIKTNLELGDVVESRTGVEHEDWAKDILQLEELDRLIKVRMDLIHGFNETLEFNVDEKINGQLTTNAQTARVSLQHFKDAGCSGKRIDKNHWQITKPGYLTRLESIEYKIIKNTDELEALIPEFEKLCQKIRLKLNDSISLYISDNQVKETSFLYRKFNWMLSCEKKNLFNALNEFEALNQDKVAV